MKLLRKLSVLFFRRKLDADMAEEMRGHVEMQTAANVARGMSPDEARRAAYREFGHVDGLKEACRDQRRARWLEDLWRDLWFAARLLRRSPGFAVTAIATVALGVGANTAIFSVLNAVVLRPLPFPEPERLVQIVQTNHSRNVTQFSVSHPVFRDWSTRSRSWEALSAMRDDSVNLQTAGDPEQLSARLMTANTLAMFGLRVARGREFLPEDDVSAQGEVAILSDALWRRAFSADPAVLGRAIIVNGRPLTVVGIAPKDFGLNGGFDIFLPGGALVQDRRNQSGFEVYGRLKRGVSLDEARAEMEALVQQFDQENDPGNRGWGVRLVPLFDAVVGRDFRHVLVLLLSAVGVLLLIACANLSSLLLVRASARTRELAIRSALGGSRGRLIRQLVTESMLLAALGGIAGVVLAYGSGDFFKAIEGPRAEEIRIDGRVLLFGGVVTLLTGLLAGFGPALQASRAEPQSGLKGNLSGARGGTQRLRNLLIVGQLALSIVLLTAAGLMLRTLDRLHRVDLGFKPDRVITLQVNPLGDREVFLTRLLERIAAIPEVEAVGSTSGPPMGGGRTGLNVFPVGPAAMPATQSLQSEWRAVSQDYFTTLGIPLLKGRVFTPGDDGQAAKVVIVNATFARLMWGDEDALGKQVSPGGGPRASTVIGVVGDIRSRDPTIAPVAGFYMPVYRGIPVGMTLVIRSRADAQRIASAVRAEVKALDPTLPVFEIRTLEEMVSDRLTTQRVVAGLLVAFGVVALSLAAIGIYGIMAYSTAQRTREIGIRMALGAQRLDILKPLLRECGALIAVGCTIGLACALATTRLMSSLLSEVRPNDPLTLAGATLLLSLVAVLACYAPARRALRVDPRVAFHAE